MLTSQDTERFLDKYQTGKKKKKKHKERHKHKKIETARKEGRGERGNKLNYRRTAGLNS